MLTYIRLKCVVLMENHIYFEQEKKIKSNAPPATFVKCLTYMV